MPCWRTKAAISMKYVKMEEKLLWRAYIVRAQPLRRGTGGEVKEWVGDRLKEEGEWRGEQGRPSNGE